MNFPISHRRGSKAAYESKSDDPRLRCVFEDDGATGYLYALDYTDGSAQPIKDAVGIYDVETANDVELTVVFRWTADGRRCALFVDGVGAAFVDFDKRLAGCRSNFPQVSIWTRQPRTNWSDTLLVEFES